MTIKEVVKSGIVKRVKFYDGEKMCAGIMMGDKIICGCCGGIFEVKDIIEDAHEDGIVNPILMYIRWVDLSDKIRGNNDNDNDYLLHGTVALEVEDM